MKFFAATLSLSLALFAFVEGHPNDPGGDLEDPDNDGVLGCRAIPLLDLPAGVGDAFDGDCQECLDGRTCYPCNNTPRVCTDECFGETAPPVSAPDPTPRPTNRPTPSPTNRPTSACRAIPLLDLTAGVGDAFDGDCQECLNGRTCYPCNNTPRVCTDECFDGVTAPPVASPTPRPTPAQPVCRAKRRSELPSNIGATTTAECRKCLRGQSWYPCNNQRICTSGCFD